MSGGVVSGVNQFRHAISDGGGCKARAINEYNACITANTRIICGRGEA